MKITITPVAKPDMSKVAGEEALRGRACVPAAQAHRAVNNLHDLKHSFDQYHFGIIGYYSDISNYIPRLKVDYFSL